MPAIQTELVNGDKHIVNLCQSCFGRSMAEEELADFETITEPSDSVCEHCGVVF